MAVRYLQPAEQVHFLQQQCNMTLGGLDTKKIGAVTDSDFDFTALQNKVHSIEQKQNYMLVGLLLLLILTLTKK